MNKREFVRTMGSASLGLMFGPEVLARMAAVRPEALAEDEAFWASIRGKYRLTPDYINLETQLVKRNRVLDAEVKHRVYTVAINRPEAGILGIRITPHLFTTTADLDALVKGLLALAA
jgi:hypothetical protein